MADEDIQDQDQAAPANTDTTELRSELQRMQDQLAQMNLQYQQNMQSIVEAVTRSDSKQVEDDTYMTDEEKQLKALKAEIEELKSFAPKQTQEILKRERELNNTVVRLAADYPEIQSDSKMRQAVLDQHAKLPQSLRDTAEGYELAVQRAVAQAGLVPKARRQASSQDADSFASPGSRSGGSASSQPRKKAKVSERTLMIAQLLGRNIEDPNVLKGLEEAANRDTYSKYR